MMLLSVGLSAAFVLIVLLVVAVARLGERVDRAVDGVYEHMESLSRAHNALDDLVDGAVKAGSSDRGKTTDRIDDAFAAISRMHKRIGVAVKDADIARGLAMQPVSDPPTHAPCALCGKQGHVVDMEGMTGLDMCSLTGKTGPMAMSAALESVHLHPECLVEAGCERVEAVAGGWRRKVVE